MPWIPRDLYDLLLAKLREPVESVNARVAREFDTLDAKPPLTFDSLVGGATTTHADYNARPLRMTPTPLPDLHGITGAFVSGEVAPKAPDVVVALDNGALIGLPDTVVNACIHEARGNTEVMERQFAIAARMVSLGMDPDHIAMQMRAGDLMEV